MCYFPCPLVQASIVVSTGRTRQWRTVTNHQPDVHSIVPDVFKQGIKSLLTRIAKMLS